MFTKIKQFQIEHKVLKINYLEIAVYLKKKTEVLRSLLNA